MSFGQFVDLSFLQNQTFNGNLDFWAILQLYSLNYTSFMTCLPLIFFNFYFLVLLSIICNKLCMKAH